MPTVSKVVNGRSGVAADTGARVEGLINKHGYRKPSAGTPARHSEMRILQWCR